jgi:stage II sporulation protein R
MVGFEECCTEMYDNIIRIRIIANSDSEYDQRLKLSVRDAVLNASKNVYKDVDSYDDAIALTEQSTDLLLEAAKRTINSSGANYQISLDFRQEFFDTREYDEFTLPAGNYKTAVFTIGEGKGKNWWCVIYPAVCVGACSDRLDNTLSQSAADFAYSSDKYVIKFKTVEIFEKIKNYLDF